MRAWSLVWRIALPCVLLLHPVASAAQLVREAHGAVQDAPVLLFPARWSAQRDSLALSPGLAMAASAALPGAGQLLMGAERWVPFAAVEAWGWVSYLSRRARSRSREQLYKDLAWSVARRISTGGRRDTVFDYYESMTRFAASGAYDTNPQQPGIQPELDARTFNGEKWLLARSLFIPGGTDYPPGTIEYQRALDYYVRHAIPSSFAWAWGDSNLEQQVFIELIRESDAAQRRATWMLGAIIANHVVSAIDALVLARLGSGDPALRVGSGLEPDRHGVRWTLEARLRW